MDNPNGLLFQWCECDGTADADDFCVKCGRAKGAAPKTGTLLHQGELLACTVAGIRQDGAILVHFDEGGSKGYQLPVPSAMFRASREYLDALCASHTGFSTFADLVRTSFNGSGYRPTIRNDEYPELAILADGYDDAMRMMGKNRRAFRGRDTNGRMDRDTQTQMTAGIMAGLRATHTDLNSSLDVLDVSQATKDKLAGLVGRVDRAVKQLERVVA